MWELDYKEGWVLKNWCFRTVVLEKTLESPLDLTNLKGNQHWSFTFSNSCWSWSFITLATWCEELTHWKGPWCWERLRAGGEGDDKGWDGLNGHEFAQTPGDGEGQGSLACCSPQGTNELDTWLSDWTTIWGSSKCGISCMLPLARFNVPACIFSLGKNYLSPFLARNFFFGHIT